MNNSPIAFVTDLHFGVSNFSKPVFEEQMKFFEKQFFPFLLKFGIKEVICCGDFFHSRERCDWYILNQLKSRFFQWFDDNDITFRAIVGNHDTQFRDRIDENSLTKNVEEFKNTIVYAETKVENIGGYKIGFVPWIVDQKTYEFPLGVDIIAAHLELKNFPMLKGINSKDGYDHKVFGPYRMVLSGHYHIHHVQDNVHMIGTPYQLTWNDYDVKKGFYVLANDCQYRFFENTVNAKYLKIYYNNGELECEGFGNTIHDMTPEDCIDYAKENYCRIMVMKADDQLKLEQFQASLQAVSCNNHKIDIVHLQDVVDNFDSESFDEAFENEESTINVVMSIIDGMAFERGIDKDRLMKLAQAEYSIAFDEAYGDDEE